MLFTTNNLVRRLESKRKDLRFLDQQLQHASRMASSGRLAQGALEHHGQPGQHPQRLRASHVIGLGLADALAYAVPSLPPSEYGRLAERYRAHFLARDPGLPLFPGTRAMLERLRDRGQALAIATGKSRAGLARALATTGLADLFDATRCADQCASKPAPEMLLALMAELAAAPERTLMIGDTSHDLQMAANAGGAAVPVSYGAHAGEALAALAPLALVHWTDELAAWLATNA